MINYQLMINTSKPTTASQNQTVQQKILKQHIPALLIAAALTFIVLKELYIVITRNLSNPSLACDVILRGTLEDCIRREELHAAIPLIFIGAILSLVLLLATKKRRPKFALTYLYLLLFHLALISKAII